MNAPFLISLTKTRNVMGHYDKWWSSLKVTEKERIASKIVRERVTYPKCTDIWHSLTDEQQEWVHAHCTDYHGVLVKEWFEGTPYGD